MMREVRRAHLVLLVLAGLCSVSGSANGMIKGYSLLEKVR